MNLKLAEYNKDGKFERFIEMPNFGYFDEFLITCRTDITNEMCRARYAGEENLIKFHYKDEKDPLHRFNGLFDGRTYGKGRFVLIVDEEDSFRIPPVEVVFADDEYRTLAVETIKAGIKFNLHENPELWEKVK